MSGIDLLATVINLCKCLKASHYFNYLPSDSSQISDYVSGESMIQHGQ